MAPLISLLIVIVPIAMAFGWVLSNDTRRARAEYLLTSIFDGDEYAD